MSELSGTCICTCTFYFTNIKSSKTPFSTSIDSFSIGSVIMSPLSDDSTVVRSMSPDRGA